MDGRLVTWGRAVKSRFRVRPGHPAAVPLPPLWLFTDPARMDVLRAVAALPPGLCGVVFRHDGVPGRRKLLGAVARLCRARRTALVVAGAGAADGGWRAGRHLRAGHRLPHPAGRGRKPGLDTASAHGVADLVRAHRAGAACCFLSPVFPTTSHPGAPALGPVRWGGLARQAGRLLSAPPVLALGGVDGHTARRLPRHIRGVGAIGALLP